MQFMFSNAENECPFLLLQPSTVWKTLNSAMGQKKRKKQKIRKEKENTPCYSAML